MEKANLPGFWRRVWKLPAGPSSQWSVTPTVECDLHLLRARECSPPPDGRLVAPAVPPTSGPWLDIPPLRRTPRTHCSVSAPAWL